jgi:hypothetical protein
LRFGQALYKSTDAKIRIREEQAEGTVFSNPFRLFLCSTTAALSRYHRDHEEMRKEELTSETKIKE